MRVRLPKMNNPSSVSTPQVGRETLSGVPFGGGSSSDEYDQGDEESPDEDEQGSPLGHSSHPRDPQVDRTVTGPFPLFLMALSHWNRRGKHSIPG